MWNSCGGLAGAVVVSIITSNSLSAGTVTIDFLGRVTQSFDLNGDRLPLPPQADVGDLVEGEIEFSVSSDVSRILPANNNFPSTTYRWPAGITASSTSITVNRNTWSSSGNLDGVLIDDGNIPGLPAGDAILFRHQGNVVSAPTNFQHNEIFVSFREFGPGNAALVGNDRDGFDPSNLNFGRSGRNVDEGTGSVQRFSSLDFEETFVLGFDIDEGSIEVTNTLPSPSLAPLTNFSLAEATSSEFVIDGDLGEDFDDNAPTVIVTHGRQPGMISNPYTGDPFDVDALSETYDAIKLHHPETNVILITWEEAFVRRASVVGPQSSFLGPLADSNDVGIQAAQEIAREIPDYEGSIHVIGHSYGTAVNNALAPHLRSLGLDVEQLTVLDAPFNLPNSELIDLVDYQVLNPEVYSIIGSQFDIFDNYYGTAGGIFDPAWGDEIESAQLDGGYSLNTGHGGVFEEYIASIGGNSDLINETGGGFRGPLRPDPPEIPRIIEYFFPSQTNELNAFYDPLSLNFGGSESSDAYLFWETTDILEFDVLAFTIDSLVLGADDWFEVLLGGSTIMFFDSNSRVSDFDVFLPVSEDNFASSSLAFLLTGNGQVDASFSFSNLRGISLESERVAPVPLPASFHMLIAACLCGAWTGRRRRFTQCHPKEA